MMTDEIISKIRNLTPVSDGNSYSLITIDKENGPFFGKNQIGNVCFVIPSTSAHPRQSSRATKELSLILDLECGFNIDGGEYSMLSNILVCKSSDDTDIAAFIRLCTAFADDDLNSRSITELFSALTRLFTTKRQSDVNAVTGLFGELYTIYYLESQEIDVSKAWQKKDLMKFDFTISPTKRLEVKTAVGSERKHHFKHEQLYYEDYDIMVVSLMLREANQGISVFDVVDFCRKKYASDYARLNIIENKLSDYSDDELKGMVYDETYLERNIKFVPASEVPRFKEKSPNNLTNAEYDCNLGEIIGITIDQLRQWMP
jgi:hypothetical protein